MNNDPRRRSLMRQGFLFLLIALVLVIPSLALLYSLDQRSALES